MIAHPSTSRRSRLVSRLVDGGRGSDSLTFVRQARQMWADVPDVVLTLTPEARVVIFSHSRCESPSRSRWCRLWQEHLSVCQQERTFTRSPVWSRHARARRCNTLGEGAGLACGVKCGVCASVVSSCEVLVNDEARMVRGYHAAAQEDAAKTASFAEDPLWSQNPNSSQWFRANPSVHRETLSKENS